MCNKALGRTFAAIGGALVGMISVGHVYGFAEEGKGVLDQAIQVAMFTVPGVLIGVQIGPRVQARVNPDKMKVLVSWIFMGVGAFMLSTLLD